jgi:hypothetical protein
MLSHELLVAVGVKRIDRSASCSSWALDLIHVVGDCCCAGSAGIEHQPVPNGVIHKCVNISERADH